MNLDSFMKEPATREAKKPTKSKEKKKSVRLGSLFGKRDTTPKKAELPLPLNEIERLDASLHPGGSKSPRGLSLRSDTKNKGKRIKGSKSVQLDSKNLNNSIQPQTTTTVNKAILTVPPSPSPRGAKVPYDPQSDPIYKLRRLEEELKLSTIELKTVPVFSKRIERYLFYFT